MDQSRLDRPGRRALSGAPESTLSPMRFEPPKLSSFGVGRIGRSTVEAGVLAFAREEARNEVLVEMAAAIEAHRRAQIGAEEAAAALVAALDQIERADLGRVHEFEQQAAAFALAIAEELVGRELRLDDGIVTTTVTRAMNLLPDRGAVIMRVSPADVAALVEIAPSMGPRAANVRFVADPTIERGGCIAEVGPLRVDAQLCTAIARMKEAFAT